jgi:hypothetical protein
MGLSLEKQATMTAEGGDKAALRGRPLVLVAGSGRSGTSLFTGILQRMGFFVPQPEVPADETNPRGFSESQWVVDFHSALLKNTRVQMSDARPTAWALTAQVAFDEGVQGKLRSWLRKQFRKSDNVVIKDPRLSWFLPLWRRCAEDIGVSPRVVTVIRHPAAVVESKQRSYGTWQSGVGRTAGWLNQVLFTERATRDTPRVFVRYQDLLDDWTNTVARVGNLLDLAVIRDASASSVVRVHEFVDLSLSRSRSNWGDFDVAPALREQADEVWELLSRLADEDGAASPSVVEKLEAARAAYIELYEEAESIAHSSIWAGRRDSPAPVDRVAVGAARFAARVVPARYKRKVPPGWRRKFVRVLHRSTTSR